MATSAVTTAENLLKCGTKNVIMQSTKDTWMDTFSTLTTTTNLFLSSPQSHTSNLIGNKHLESSVIAKYDTIFIRSPKTFTTNKLLDILSAKQNVASEKSWEKSNQDFTESCISKDAAPEISVKGNFESMDITNNDMPSYKFPSLEFENPRDNKHDTFLSVADELLLRQSNKEKYEDHQKMLLVNEVSASLIGGVDFKNHANKRRKRIVEIANSVVEFDPEFLLKVALYSRQELNIRTTSNFLLALASYHEKCRAFLRKYFCASVRLPTDWIEVAELYTTLARVDKDKKLGSLPTVLRRAMKEKFPDFDTYQLGKYKKDSSKKPKKRKATTKTADAHAESENDDDDDNGETVESKTFRLKYLIRMLHISDPAFHVMALIGKSYPENAEKFRTSRLEGTWEPEKAGKRMKLPIPQTWETQLSLKGNSSSTWEELIDSKKLPYMALLRNIRNIILADVSKGHHTQVLNRINNENAVIHSRQLPFRFLAAHEVVDEIKNRKSQGDQGSAEKKKAIPTSVSWKLLERYHTALDGAIAIAAIHNLPAIAGKTMFFKNVGYEMDSACITARGLGQSRSMKSVADLLCEMCTKACESCREYTYNTELYGDNSITQIWFETLTDLIYRKVKIDTLIVVTDADANIYFLQFVSLYRLLVNNRLLFVTISLNGSQPSVAADDELDVKLVGFSDNILRFIAQRGHSSLLSYIDNIDTKYKLKKSPSLAPTCEEFDSHDKTISPFIRQPRWRTVRVFISSTFVDMHGERDLLVRYVFPELRERARRLFVDLYEVDLRWGINEEESTNQKMLEICLKEVSKCQLFIGILGERYGSIPLSYQVNDDSGLEWLQDYPAGASITELEIQQAALANPTFAKSRAFFYIRDKSFIRDIPREAAKLFTEQSEVPKSKLGELKSRIRKSGLEVFDKYPCEWSGSVNGKYVVSGLEKFGERIINNVWNAIQSLYNVDDDGDDDIDVDSGTPCASSELELQRAHIEKVNCSFIGRSEFVSDAASIVKSHNEGFILIAGRQGCGKTYIMTHLFSKLEDDKDFTHSILPCFVNAMQHCGRALNVLHYLCRQLKALTKLKRGTKVDDMDAPALLNCYLNEISGRNSCVVIFIDGVDTLNEVDQLLLLNSIPNPLPTGIVIVCSASIGTPLFKEITRKDHVHLKVKPLLIKERTQIARNILSLYGKTLNENAFNNQLTALTFKRECSLPIYIELACQILCEYAVFEDLDNKIKSMDNTVTGLLLSCVDEARDEFGKDVTDAFLVLLSISPEGLTKDSMHCLMSLYMQLNNTEFDLNTVLQHLKQQSFILARVLIERLVTALKAFVCCNRKADSEVFVTAINPHLFEQVLNTSCGSKSSVAKIRTQLFIIKSGMLISLADPFFDRSWKGKNAEALSLIPHHIFESHSYQDLEDILCDFEFISAKIEMGLATELLEDFQAASRAKTRKFFSDQLMKEMGAFYVKNQHIFQKSPHLLLQTAVNCEDDLIASMAEDLIEMKYCEVSETRLYLKVHSPLQKSYCKQTLNCKKAIFCVEICPDTDNFAIGEDNVLKVYDSSNLKEIHSFYGHLDAITSVCYIGKDRLCSGSFDGELCLWDLVKDIRLATMSGHEKSVTGCLCDHTGLVIVSVSLDRTIRTWSARTGKHISTMNVSKSPINCLDLHPYSHMAVIGNWNKTIEIWDLLQCKYVSNIEYMSASVQSVKISPDAKYIVSSMLDGNISIWSFDMRIELITLQTNMPIRAIAFSKSGDLLAAGDDCAIKKWKFCFNDVQCHLKGNNNNQCTAVMVFNYEKVAVGYADGFVDIFSCETNAVIKSVQVSNSPVRILCKHEEHDGIIVVTAPYVRIMPVSSNKAIVVLQGSYDAMAVASSLDGYLIVTGNSSGLVFIYRYMDLINKNYLPQFCNWPAHEEGIVAIAYGVNKNKDKFVTASTDNLVKLWTTPFHDKCNPRGLKKRDWGKEISPDAYRDEIIKTEHASKILSCNWINTDCGKSYLLILSYADGHIVAINGASHKQQWSVFAHNAPVSHLYHCRYNNAILSFATDGSCKLWAYSGVELLSVESNGASCIGAYAKAKINCAEENHCVHGGLKVCKPSIHGIVIGRATRYGEVSVERMGMKDMGTMVGHLDSIMSLSVSATDNIVTSALDGSVKMWDLADAESSKQQFTHVGEITTVTFNSRFIILLTTDSNGEALIWKYLEGWTPIVKFKAHESAVKCACFLGPTWNFVTGSLDGMKLWKYEGPMNPGQLDEDEEVNVKFLSEHFQSVLCCDYNVLSREMFAGTSSGDIWSFDIKINEKDPSGRDWINRHCPVYSNDSRNPCNCIVSIKCVKGLNYIIYATVSGILGVLKIVEKSTIEQYLQIDLQEDPTFNMKNCIPTALTILPHSKNYRYFAVGFSDGSVMYASFTSKKSSDKSDKLELNKIATHVDGVNGLSYASEMQQLWTGGKDGKIKVWNNDCQARSLIQVAEHQCTAPITCMEIAEGTAFAGDILGNVYFITPLN